MFEAYTYDALLADVLANAPEGIDKRKGSIFYDAVSGVVMQIAKMYTDIEQVFDYVFIATASGEFLDLRAAEYGMERLSATAAKYHLVYEGTSPAVGARFFHNDTGKYFYIENSGGDLLLVAEETGTGCNDIPSGDLAIPVITIEGLATSTFGDVYEYGTEAEADDDLRSRLQEKIAGPAENGNKQHYKTWCESVTGVGLARITPLWNGPNTVKGTLISPLGLPCSNSVVEAVQEYIDPATNGGTVTVNDKTYTVGDGLGEGVANLGAHFTAAAADSVGVSVAFNALLADGKTAADAQEEVSAELEEYIKDLVMNSGEDDEIVLRITEVGAVITKAKSVIDYSGLTLNGEAKNIYLGEDGVPVLSEVVVNVGI